MPGRGAASLPTPGAASFGMPGAASLPTPGAASFGTPSFGARGAVRRDVPRGLPGRDAAPRRLGSGRFASGTGYVVSGV
ncbi:hypothetical protein MPOR_49130 [Mycolicibacterium poriferae]|uniref:Uncharacterized protein n=1 Tax=Mycolicibacterium poriferae TaxID=39694 RepID=A0A6N4VJY3_9MYCO|nr:hypothetical protein MPOR_49130 [Mycolicibacterium poriferae]